MCVSVYLTVSEVKVKQIPPKPFIETAINMRADNTVEEMTENAFIFHNTFDL